MLVKVTKFGEVTKFGNKPTTFYDGAGTETGAGGAGTETGAGGAGTETGAGGAGTGAGAGTETPEEKEGKKVRQYSQTELDRIVESERSRLKEQTRSQISQLEDLKKNLTLTEESKTNLQLRIDELNKTLLSKEELAKREKESVEKAAKVQIESLSKEKETWETRYKESMMTQQLVAASTKMEVFNPDVMVNLLWNKTNVVEIKNENGTPTGKFAVKVNVDGKDKDGKPQELSLDPYDAVKFIKDDPNYHFMFKGTAGNGVGGSGNKLTPDVDPSKMTPEQYRKYRDQFKKGSN